MPKQYLIVLGFIVFDIATGIIKALSKEGLNSTALRKGLFHKLSEVMCVFGAYMLEYAFAYINIGIDPHFSEGVTFYICVMEFISVLENLSEVNPKLAQFFKPYLEKLKTKEDKQ